MLRECARYEALAKIMLHSDEFFNFFRYVEVSTFDIASDAFSTFKVRSARESTSEIETLAVERREPKSSISSPQLIKLITSIQFSSLRRSC